MPLREDEKRVLRAISEIEARGDRPSFGKIARAAGIRSTGSIFNHLNRLEAAGFVERRRFVHRSIRLLRMPEGAAA